MEDITMAKKEKYEDYQVSSDVDSLIRANEILNDKSKLPMLKAEFKKRREALNDTTQQLNIEVKTKKAVKKLLGKK